MTHAKPNSLRDRAVNFARERHGDQRYGSGPYAAHLAAVEQVLMDFGFVADHWRAAAWLHDVIEDCAVTRAELAEQFGDLVGEVVWACTGEGASRWERVASVFWKLRERPSACALKVADRIANVEAAESSSHHMRMYQGEQHGLSRVCKAEVPVAMWDRLERALVRP